MSLNVSHQKGKTFSVVVTPQTSLSITPDKQYNFDCSSTDCFERTIISPQTTKFRHPHVVLKIDVLHEFKVQIEKTLNPSQSKLHHVITGLPIPYGLAPTRLRDFLMKTDVDPENLSLRRQITNRCLTIYSCKCD